MIYRFVLVFFLSHRFGETDILSFGIKDGIVLPDEDVTQDPELLGATLTKAGDAFIIALYGEQRFIYVFSPELRYSLFFCPAGIKLT